MEVILKILIYLYLCSGLQCANQISWLPCQFTDEYIYKKNHTETQLLPKDVVLQFGQKGDAPVNPHNITFLVIEPKLDLRRYVEGAGAEQLECELRWSNRDDIQLRWPRHRAQDYDSWFSCTLKHTEGLFTVTGYLRHTPAQPSSGQRHYHRRPTIGERDVLTTSVAMVLQTRTPSVTAALKSQQKLHCQFAIDHKVPKVQVEWHRQRRGERTTLFSHTSRSGDTQGTGVSLVALAGGDASLTLPLIKTNSEGTYSCFVSVPPLFGSLDMTLHVQEPPRVSLNVGPSVVLVEGGDQNVVCEAKGYYPLDVDMAWYQQEAEVSGKRVGPPLPMKLQNVLLSSHKPSQEGTYSVSAFFYLQASLRDSGSQFTCIVSHKSLPMPIHKSFTLTVKEPSSWMINFSFGFIAVMCVVLCCLRSGRGKSNKRKTVKTVKEQLFSWVNKQHNRVVAVIPKTRRI